MSNFVETVVAAHPDKFIFCIDLFTHYADFKPAAPKAEEFREVVRQVAAKYESGKVVHVDGWTILASPTGLFTYLVHPSDEGMQEMGEKLAALIRRVAVW